MSDASAGAHAATPPPSEYGPEDRRLLLALARGSIEHGLEHGRPRPVDLASLPGTLHRRRASFVTLHLGGDLRGCIGRLEATRPLAEDVAENAFAAAFTDPRFPPLASAELPRVHLDISVLGEPERLTFTDEADLLRQLRPGVDGLILREAHLRGTFLPAVWASLPDPKQFLTHLKMKAGLLPEYWSATLEVWRYTAEAIEEDAAG
jgi:hypothetical protein